MSTKDEIKWGSRLDKLLKLLDDGKTPEIRRAAAEQVAGIIVNRPRQLHVIVSKVSNNLYSKNWDTRVSSSHCLGLIAEHCVHHDVVSLTTAARAQGSKEEVDRAIGEMQETHNTWESLDSLDVDVVLEKAKPLVASTGQEYALALSTSGELDLEQQKKRLKARLGLDGFSDQIINTEEFIKDEDFEVEAKAATDIGESASKVLEGMSARERAISKSKKRRGQDLDENTASKKGKVENGDSGFTNLDTMELIEEMWSDTVAGKWPFQTVADRLCVNLLNPVWEIRHGAALGLREIIRYQSKCAGVVAPIQDVPTGWLAAEGRGKPSLSSVSSLDVQNAILKNNEWLEDCAIHVLCVLALDRFGDYVSDEVVPPVRETVAQVLGIICRELPDSATEIIFKSLMKISKSSNWESRHGALTGMKYCVASQEGLSSSAFQNVMETALLGLQDDMEDVKAVASDILIPCANKLARDSSDVGLRIKRQLWDALLNVDPLNLATRGAAKLLQSVFDSIHDVSLMPHDNLTRLWYHFTSDSSSIRIASIRCYKSILMACNGQGMSLDTHETGLLLLLRTIAMDEINDVAQISYESCRRIIDSLSSSQAQETLDDTVQKMFHIVEFRAEKALVSKANVELPYVEGLTGYEPSNNRNCVAKEHSNSRRHLLCDLISYLGYRCISWQTLIQELVLQFIRSDSGLQRQIGAFICSCWSKYAREMSSKGPVCLISAELAKQLNRKFIYSELLNSYSSLSEQAQQLNIEIEDLHAWTIEQVKEKLPSLSESGESRYQVFESSLMNLKRIESSFHVSVMASMAAAIVDSAELPPKLNGLIQPLVAAIRRESDIFLQDLAAKALAQLIWLVLDRVPSPSQKIIRNLCLFACSDREHMLSSTNPPNISEGIQALENSEMSNNGTNVTSRGGIIALQELVSLAINDLEVTLSEFWRVHIVTKLSDINGCSSIGQLQEAIDACFILEKICPFVNPDCSSTLSNVYVILIHILSIQNIALQIASARAMAAVAKWNPNDMLPGILDGIDGLVKDGAPDSSRLGGVLAIHKILMHLESKAMAYIPLVIIYLMRRMNDSKVEVRSFAAGCFSTAVSLMPLSQGITYPERITDKQKKLLEKDGQFLSQLIDNQKVEDYRLPFNLLTGNLRRYQQEGINWLAFLKQFGLHGILADDMGLGKTLQSTAIIAAATIEQATRYSSSLSEEDRPKPSLVVCPATLVSHWPHEIEKFVSHGVLKPLALQGPAASRTELRRKIDDSTVVVISYENLRSDIDWISKRNWLYMILDEGHAIRNPTSKLSEAVRSVRASHRLILSGTPVQNSVLELWAMFEFLMPRFLGTLKEFNRKFGKSVERAKKSRTNAKEQTSVLALQDLHKQVMPFILRRTKDQVLQDLPPKTIQDVFCDPSALQEMLLQDFHGSGVQSNIQEVLDSKITAESKGHIFQALNYLRKLCSHPVLVLDKKTDSHIRAIRAVLGEEYVENWDKAKSIVSSHLIHSPKLAALKELLLDCGIGCESGSESNIDAGHRALIFAQTKAMLDLAEKYVLEPMQVSSLRIDGSIAASERFVNVQKFNSDPTIDVMLLTTAVGGLGLNLTAADTVIFLEHDWNPQKDIQAMDRAHRLGQRNAVNVYRILVKGTLEESIMSLQRFKLDVAATVVNADNISMKAMDTGSLLDTLVASKESEEQEKKVITPKTGLAAILAELPDLDETAAQYQTEFDLDAFRKSMGIDKSKSQ
eukprot:jgi/Picsp_1/238/NSC_00237-R1_snf2 super family